MSQQNFSHLPPLRLLSLDGGGVRGLSSLIILEKIMEGIAEEEKRLGKRHQSCGEKLRPCDYFDLIGGTSTGGIIAVLLARLRLTATEAVEIYSRLSKEIFEQDRSINVLGFHLRPFSRARFSGAVLEECIKRTLREKGYDEEELMWDASLFEETGSKAPVKANIKTVEVSADGNLKEISKIPTWSHLKMNRFGRRASLKIKTDTLPALVSNFEPKSPSGRSFVHIESKPAQKSCGKTLGCHGFVVATYKTAIGGAKVFPTYDPNDKSTKIWQALRATSAAPTFFDEIQIGTPPITYIDGGIGANNPTTEVVEQAGALWPGREIGVIVSVGTGLKTMPNAKERTGWSPFGLKTEVKLAGALVELGTSTTKVAQVMQMRFHNTSTAYHRFDVDVGLSEVSLEQWMKEDEMGSATEQYMARKICERNELARTITKLSDDPKVIECSAGRFEIQPHSSFSLRDPAFPHYNTWSLEAIDVATGYPIGISPPSLNRRHSASLTMHSTTMPVLQDLDNDGHRHEAQILTCFRVESSKILLRALLRGVPRGAYKVSFVMCFFREDSTQDSLENRNPKVTDTDEDTLASESGSRSNSPVPVPRALPPNNLVLSAGSPRNAETFKTKPYDHLLNPDASSFLLNHDAVRVRVGSSWEENLGKGWVEVNGQEELNVELDGTVGLMVSCLGDEWVGGWSLGGVRLIPVVKKEGESMKRRCSA